MAQETLEEAFSNYLNEKYHSPTQGSIPDLESARFGAKWQQEQETVPLQKTLKEVEENIDREEWINFFKNNSKEEILEYLINYKFPL